MPDLAALDGLVPDSLRPRTRKIVLEDYQLQLDIGFHEFEVGNPQRLLLTVEVWVDEASFAGTLLAGTIDPDCHAGFGSQRTRPLLRALLAWVGQPERLSLAAD